MKEAIVHGIKIDVREGVFNPDPKRTNSTAFMIYKLHNLKDKSVLDVGCGSGIISIYCALKGAKKVVAVDTNEEAIENTKENAKEHSVENIIEAKKSDLFENVEGKFDYIIGNLPISERAWKIDTTALTIKFITESGKYVNAGGKVYFSWASIQKMRPIEKFLQENKYRHKIFKEAWLGKMWYVFELDF